MAGRGGGPVVEPALVCAVGPAAAGKSTVLGRLLESGTVDLVVSTDAVRAELGLAPAETRTAYATARARVRQALASGAVVAVDATNVRSSDRARWHAVAREAGARPLAMLVGVDLDLAELLARDAGRDRHVPADVIADQLALARRSTPAVLASEGFEVVDASLRTAALAAT